MAKSGDFLWGVAVFVVGSLVLTFFWNNGGDIVSSVKEKSNEIFSSSEPSQVNSKYIRVDALRASLESNGFMSEATIDSLLSNPQYRVTFSCSNIEAQGEMSGISDPKGKSCRNVCSIKGLDYGKYQCENNNLICYCKEYGK